MTIQNVTVLGTGVLGAQIAYQSAYHGMHVTAYDITDDVIAKARMTIAGLAQTYLAEVPGASQESVDAAVANIRLTTDLADAVQDADLVIEAIPEILELKQQVFGEIHQHAPKDAILATNSSTLLPSKIAPSTGRPDRFLALHFANRIWAMNVAEVMSTADTDPEVFEQVVQFAKAIGMVPVQIHKEKAGYVLNSLLVPFLSAAMELASENYAEPADIDATWRIGTGAPLGPFQIYDIIGLNTPYNILVHGDETARSRAAWLKANYIDHGWLGAASGRGFYTYSQD